MGQNEDGCQYELIRRRAAVWWIKGFQAGNKGMMKRMKSL